MFSIQLKMVILYTTLCKIEKAQESLFLVLTFGNPKKFQIS